MRSLFKVTFSTLIVLASLLDVEAGTLRGGVTTNNGHNGGKSQIGVNFLQIANDFVFMNAFKSAQSWSYGDNSGAPEPTELDVNGYPIPGSNCFSHGGVYTVFFVPLQSERPGNYVATWDGISNLRLGMSNTVLPSATFTGSVTAGILTAGAPSGGTIQKGMTISTIGGRIGDQITGTAGQAGTYFVTGLTSAGSQSMTITGGSSTGPNAMGNRYVFSTIDYRFAMGFLTATQTPSNLRVFHVDDEAELDAGEIVGKKFRQVWAYMNPGVIRFGDWTPMNTSNQTTWDTRKPINYVFYSGAEYRASMWAGVTTNSGNDYTAPITPTGWTGLVDKATVIIKFNSSASADNSTLNVAGTGAIPIRDWYGNPTSTGANTRPVAGLMATLIYDAVLNVWIKHGGDVAGNRVGITNGVPPEVMLAVAAKVRAHPYVTTPYLAGDPLTDYMPSLATYFRDNSPSWMIPRFEATNELWNNAAAFFGTRYAWNKANAYWGISFGQHEWVAKEASLLGQAISTVYSGNRSRYQVLLGVQSYTACNNAACTIDGTSGSNERLTASTWVTAGSPTQSGYTISPAYNWVTHIAAANYVNPTRYFQNQELTDAFAYVVTNAGNTAAQNALADSYVNTLSTGGPCSGGNLGCVKNMMQFWYGWAQNNWGGSIKLGLTAYEGGYSPDFYGNNWTSPITGATAANPSVLTLATTENAAFNTGNGNPLSGNPAAAGMTLSIPMTITGVTQAASAVVTVSGFNVATVGKTISISGFSVESGTGMEQLNGTWTVSARTATTITLSVNSSAFTPYVSGGTATATATVASVAGNSVTTDINGAGTGFSYSAGSTAFYDNAALYTNTLRSVSKFRPALQTQMTQHYTDMAAVPMLFPSHFFFSGPSVSADSRPNGAPIGTGQAWGLYDQSVYAIPYSPAVESIRLFNQ